MNYTQAQIDRANAVSLEMCIRDRCQNESKQKCTDHSKLVPDPERH